MEENALHEELAVQEPESEEAPTREPAAEEEPSPEEEAVPEEGAPGMTDADFARLAEEDLSELRAHLPGLSTLAALSDPHRYGELREAGLSPLEAYLATDGKRLLGKRQENRTHLASSLLRSSRPAGGRIGADELTEARELFPSLSDREIEALWRRARQDGRRR